MRLLLITHHFGDTRSIGAVRMRGIAKYLPEFGWDVTVLTPFAGDANGYDVKEVPFTPRLTRMKSWIGVAHETAVTKSMGIETSGRDGMDRLSKAVMDIVQFPDPAYSWLSPAVREARSIVDGFDAVMSSSNPVTPHLVASRLHDVPWVADLRDPWSSNPYDPHIRMIEELEAWLERDTLSRCSAMTTVSQPLVEFLRNKHPGKRVECLLNGFDPEIVSENDELTDELTITYTGTLYEGKRDPAPLFEALSMLDERSFRVRFFGPSGRWLRDMVASYGLDDIVEIFPRVSRSEALAEQRRSHVLLCLNGFHPLDRGVYTGKVFDYLAAKRPILAIGIEGSVIESLLQETNAGVHASTVDEVLRSLRSFHNEFEAFGQVRYHGDSVRVSRHSQREMTRELAELLSSL